MGFERSNSISNVANAFGGFQAHNFAQQQQQQQQQAYLQQQQQQQPRPNMSEFPSLGSPPGLSAAMAAQQQQQQQQLYRAIAAARGGDRQTEFASKPNLSASDFPSLAESVEHDPNAPNAGDSATLGAVGDQQAMSGERPPIGKTGSIDATDRYGMLGMLATNDYGFDTSKFGLPLPSAGPLYPTFGSPWADQSQTYGLIEPDFKLPACYNQHQPPAVVSKIPSLQDETLFYVFYTVPRSELQLAAADELYRRQWRYHKELRLWLTKDPDSRPTAQTPRGEQGVFIFFDTNVWQKVKKEFLILYELLEDKGSEAAARTGAQSVPPAQGLQDQQDSAALAAQQQQQQQFQQQQQQAGSWQSTQQMMAAGGSGSGAQNAAVQQQLMMLRQRQESMQAMRNMGNPAGAGAGVAVSFAGQMPMVSGAQMNDAMFNPAVAAMAAAHGMVPPHMEGSVGNTTGASNAQVSSSIAEDVAAASMM
ncbi:transcriptional regulator [Linderina macrospora]|uniref:Transcriptional regulator n=1 Tax=Linderina macrospora TaxID=4868 RepID=A0ACC1JHC7_9FUNG|nr:transcriptional regulator [Linderina macrospora]